MIDKEAILPYLQPAPPAGLEEAQRRAAEVLAQLHEWSFGYALNDANIALAAAGMPEMLADNARLQALVTEKLIALKNEIERAERAEGERDTLAMELRTVLAIPTRCDPCAAQARGFCPLSCTCSCHEVMVRARKRGRALLDKLGEPS